MPKIEQARNPAVPRTVALEYRAVAELKPYPRNPRTHTKKQIRQIADSIRSFGWTLPVLLGDDDTILAGHARVEAAKLLGIENVPTIRLSTMTEAQKRAYVVADNKLAMNAEWHHELLAVELHDLIEIDPTFDLTLTGFETHELDIILEDADARADNADDAIPEADPAAPTVSKVGDLWLLGPHRLLCGDATKAECYECVLGGTSAQMVFTDPPYNVPIGGHVSGLGAVRHREFVMASGEMSPARFTAFLEAVFRNLAAASVNGAIHYLCMDWRHIAELQNAACPTYTELKNLCVWTKTNGGMGAFYRSQHELVFVYKSGTAPHINNFELGQHGRCRTNVWSYPGVNTMRAGRGEELRMHPTVKPVAMVADAIKDCSKRNGAILDPFAGSGTTLIAAEKTGRRCYAIELDPAYVNVAVKRWQNLTGRRACHADTLTTFAEEAATRGAAAMEVGHD